MRVASTNRESALKEQLRRAHAAMLGAAQRIADLETSLGEACDLAKRYMECEIPEPPPEDMARVEALRALAGGRSRWELDPEIDWTGIVR